ncbi:HNH endonuclease [Pseudomonas sp. EMN2]|uniref:HNH endonuclease n=1 Tax=Pseudomonas sp. EMN2 TaxID=2615212 RepID=UPI0021156BEF|nr:HNH endonuclease [Pseudomonas sp. EMN2]
MIRFTEAQRQLCAQGMTQRTANAYLEAYRCASTGTAWKSTIGVEAVRSLLEEASAAGPNQLLTCLQALRAHVTYRLGRSNQPSRGLRDLDEEFKRVLGAQSAVGSTSDMELARQVDESLAMSDDKRRARLAHADKSPRVATYIVRQFIRNPDVIAEVLLRAQGHCEACLLQAPFRRRADNTPYLEVHHRIPLADGGDDTVENAIALCPNCHRQAHFG